MTPPGPPDRRAVLKEALQAIEDLQARLDASERSRREPIAIIGAGCRFPGGVDDLDSYWRLLRDGVDAVREVPRERWSLDEWYDPDPGVPGKTYTRWGGFLDHVDTFDAPFFGVSPREAASMDPQHRLLLEVAWEALENAGLAPSGLSGSQTGVFVGITTSEYMQLHAQRFDPTAIDAYLASGNTSNACAGRLSYILGLHGPSIAVDTACSSSLVAIHLACQSLRARESNLALAGGVNVILVPETYVCFSKWGMMAKDGRCKTFDAAADGFVRSEGSGVVVLKRLADALAAGDDILAVIRGTACNQDGPSSGLSVPNGPAQQAVIRSAVADAGIDPAEVAYVEAHGTGTSLGDPIEVEALGAVLGVGRSRDRPLLIGSAKTNLGHLESSSGVAGLIKVVLALHRGEIPPHLHFKHPSPQIAWDRFPVAVPTERTAWPAWASRRLAGASAFGFSGTNAHLILEQAPPRDARAVSGLERPRHLLVLSGKGEPALRAAAGRLASFLAENSGASLADVVYSANVGRSHFADRMTLAASTADEARPKLQAFAEGRTEEGVRSGRVPSGRARVAFLFTGQGAQYAGMGRGLYETQPTFRATLERCAEVLGPHLEQPLLNVLFPPGPESSLIDQTAYTQPALFALEYALSEMWRSWGIEPTAVAGHSVGEYVAACVAGVFSLEDGLRLIAERARLMQALPPGGAMAAVLASEERVAPKLARFASTLSVAALNGPDNVVVSGRREDLDALLEELATDGVKARRLAVSHAFHSPLMDPMLEAFERAAARTTFSAPRLALISNLTGRPAGDEVAQPGYWRRHVREAVRFEAGVRALHDKGYRTFLEIGPSPTLAAMAARCLPDGSATFFTSLRKGQDDWRPLLESLAGLHLQGFEVDWRGFDRGYARTRVVLPPYPFQRERYWIKDSPQVRRAAAEPSRHPLLGHRVRSPLFAGSLFETQIATERLPFLGDHRVLNRVVFPATGYLEAASAAAEEVLGPHRLEDVQLPEALVLEEGETRTLQVALATGGVGTTFKIWSAGDADTDPASWRLHAQGKACAVAEAAPGGDSLEDMRARCRDEMSPSDFHERLRRRGLDFGPRFRAITRLFRGAGEALGQVSLPEGLDREQESYRIHPGLLDSCLQVFVASWPDGLATPEDTYLPLSLESFALRAPAPGPLWAQARLRPSVTASNDVLTGDIRLFDETGAPRGEIAGFVVKRASRSVLERAVQERTQDWLYDVEWRPQPLVADEAAGFGPDPREAAARVDLHAERLALEHRLPAYRAMLPGLEAVAGDYVVEALRSLGWTPPVGEQVSGSALAARLGVVPAHHRLFLRCLEMLGDEGVLDPAGDGWVVRRPLEERRPAAAVARVLASAPASEAQIRLVERCGRELAAVFAGAQDPLQLLFPGGSLEALERLYTGSPFAHLYNGLVQQAVLAVVDALPPGRTLRILEIGAGTGGTTASVLSVLPADRTEYVFSDVSPVFTAKAAERFREFPFVRYEVLDVEKDPESQGFGGRRFDLVLAANVIHATRDLRSVLSHVRSLAAPHGMVLLLEGTRRQRWVDLTFGLTEGWWAFTDTDLRRDYALLSEEGWQDLMRTVGFETPTAVPSEGRGKQDGQVLLLARAPKPLRTATAAGEGLGRYLVLADAGGLGRAVALGLRAQGAECVVAEAGSDWASTATGFVLDPRTPAHFDRVLDEGFRGEPCRGVIHFWALDARIGEEATAAELEQAEHSVCAGVLGLAQALARRGGQGARGLWLVTRGAQPVGPSPLSVAQASIWGLGKVLALEHPELHCVRIDLDPVANGNETNELIAEVGTDPREDQVGFRNRVRHVARLVPSVAPSNAASDERTESAPVRLETTTPGVLDSLVLRPATRRPPGPQEVELRVSATGLNFRDVLNALGMYPGDAGPLGGECSGRVVAIGAGVTRFKAGDEVVGIAAGSFGTFVTTHEALLVPKPVRLSFEDATTIPSAFMTAWYTLHRLAGIRSGERVLIHAAAGGVGMAAVQLARRAGALVFATAGNPEKREVLKRLGVSAAFDSRSLSFADDVLAHTGGEGVDVVLNSLSGDFIPSSLGLVRRGGRFLEIGKRGIWDAAQVAQLNPAITYHVVDLAAASAEDPALIGGILREVMAAVEAGELHPLPHQVFPLARAAEAFRHMAQARHVGKVVIAQAPAERSSRSPSRGTIEPAVAFAGDGTFLITGGLAGLGLLTARFLVERGVRHLALVGRRAPSPGAAAAIAEMEATGVRVLVASTDVSREDEIAALLRQIAASMPPLKGVVHSAGVLDDGAILQQDWPRFATVMGPKVWGGWALHRLTRDLPLDLFALYSSASALIGSRGQSNHAAANAFLDALAHHRRAQGRPGVSINWGAWSEIGAAAERNVGERVKGRGIGTIGPAQGLSCLQRILRQGRAQVGVVPVDWSVFLGQAGVVPPFYADLAPKAAAPTVARKPPAEDDIRARLAKAPVARRRALLVDFVRSRAVTVLGLSPSRPLDENQPLQELGLDSLMAVELRNLLGGGLGVERALSATLLFDYPSLGAVAEYLGREVLGWDSPAAPEEKPSHEAEAREELARLADEEAEALLMEELAALKKAKD